jgi:hypothetical protein
MVGLPNRHFFIKPLFPSVLPNHQTMKYASRWKKDAEELQSEESEETNKAGTCDLNRVRV